MPEPIIANYPSTSQGFVNKYTNPTLQRLLPLLPQPTANALVQFDLARAQKGQTVLSLPETASVLQTAISNTPATPPPRQSIWERTVGDLQALVSTVPRIPSAIFEEIKSLPDLPAQLAQVPQAGGFREQLAALANLPGVRFLPGAYTVGNIAENGIGAALDHPLLTALDVFPFAKAPLARGVESAVSRLPSVKSARALGATGGAVRVAGRESGFLQALRATRPIQLVSEAIGTRARDLSQLAAKHQSAIQQQATPGGPTSVLTTPEAVSIRTVIDDMVEFRGLIPEDRIREITRRLELSEPLDGLSDVELALTEKVRYHTAEMGRIMAAVKEPWRLDNIDGEFFTPDQASRVRSARRLRGRFEAMTNARTVALDASNNPGVLPDIEPRLIASEHLNRRDALRVAEAQAHALNVAGFDASRLVDTIRHARNNPSVPLDAVRAQFDDFLAAPVARPVIAPDEILRILTQYSRTTRAPKPVSNIPEGDALRSSYDAVRKINYVEHPWARGMQLPPRAQALLDVYSRSTDRQTRSAVLDELAVMFDDPTYSAALQRGLEMAGLPEQMILYRGAGNTPTGQGQLSNFTFNPTTAHKFSAKGAPIERWAVPRSAIRGFGDIDDFEVLVDVGQAVRQSATKTPSVKYTQVAVGRIASRIRNGEYRMARREFNRTLGARTRYIIPEADSIRESLAVLADRETFIAKLGEFTPRKLERVASITNRVEDRIAPARFQPLIERKVKDRLLEKYANDESAIQLIEDGFYTALPNYDPDLVSQWTREATDTWRQMKADGLDPVFVHRVSPDAVRFVNSPVVSDRLTVPSQVKARVGDARPYVKDATIALSHMGIEYLERVGIESFVNEMVTQFARPATDIIRDYIPAARRASERFRQINPSGHAESMLGKEWVRFDPKDFMPTSAPKLKLISGDKELWIPRTVANNLKRLFHDGNYRMTGVFDPVMRLFRTALLPLSPRWHIYNLFGGGTMLAAVTDPLIFTRYFSRAKDLIKSGEFHTIPDMPPGGYGSAPREIVEWGKTASFSDRIAAVHQLKAGASMRKWLAQSKGLTDKASKGIDWLYEINGRVDDMYRAMAYLYGTDKAIGKGLKGADAEAAGVALVRKVMQQWDRITPIERNTMRFIFPFYGWMNHILRYAYRFPIDHPWRTAVTASFAENELNDLGALPIRFLDTMFLGEPDANGLVTGLNLAGANPFRDVANYFTLAGFTGNLNPVIATVLQSLGIDPGKGSQDLYPNLDYDPISGRLVARNPGLVSNLVGNIIPQSRILMGMMQSNSEFKQILASNPEAAASILRSQAGLPVIFRDINLPQEQFKAELTRRDLQATARNQALRTGDYGAAARFPGLDTFFEQIRLLQGSDALQQFMPQVESPSTLEAAQRALLSMNAP